MVKRLFEYIALSILAILGLAKLKGKKVNPLALRVLLGILSFLAYCLGSSLILLFSGTWFIFLLTGDIFRRYGVDLRLFIPAPAENASGPVDRNCFEAEVNSEMPDFVRENTSFMKNCTTRLKSLIPFGKGKE